MTSDVDFYHLLDYLRIGAGHCQVNPRPKERVWSNCAPTPARYLWILRFNFFIVFTCRPAPQLSNLFLRAEQRFVPAVPASLALPSLLGPSSFEVFIHPEKNNGLGYDFCYCIKDIRSPVYSENMELQTKVWLGAWRFETQTTLDQDKMLR